MVSKKGRTRRRVVRPSTASEYDRTADRAVFNTAFDNDGERVVSLDSEEVTPTEEGKFSRDFYQEQMPPHYGD